MTHPKANTVRVSTYSEGQALVAIHNGITATPTYATVSWEDLEVTGSAAQRLGLPQTFTAELGESPDPFTDEQRRRQDALHMARGVLENAADWDMGDLADLAEFILDGTHPAAWSRGDK